MKHIQLAETEYAFAEIIWEAGKISSGDLVRECEKRFQWKKSTSYTVLRRLCDKGILKNKDSFVTALISKKEYEAIQTEQFIENNFDGSLPRFLTAFMSRKKLSKKQIQEIQKMIDDYSFESNTKST